jgi:large repetitive protein
MKSQLTKLVQLIVLFFSITTALGQNSLSIKNLDAGPGDVSKIIVGLDNTANASGFQFTLKLPNDLIVKEKEVKFIQRNTNHVIYPKNIGNGEYLFICFSATSDNFTGNSGDLLEIPVEIPLSYVLGQTYPMTFTEAIVSSALGQEIGSNHKNGVLTVIEGKNPDLKVGNITFQQNNILPNSKYTVSWEVQNIGKAVANGGWREQISLVSSEGKKYLMGNAFYSNVLAENGLISRTAEVDVPSIIGFDGNVKIEVSLITNSGVREPANAKENNTTVSTTDANLLKRLIFTIDRSEISENTTDRLRINLARSGSINDDEVFTISSDADSQFNLPATVKINKNESSNFLYIKPVNNTTYEGDKKVTLTAKGNTYNDENVNFNLIDDEKVILSLSYPANYTSTIGSKIVFTVSANFPKNKEQVISLSTDKDKRLQLPKQVTLLAGLQTVTFEGTILDTQSIEKSEIANIFAKAEGYTSAVKDIKLNSINIPTFTLTIDPNKVSEGDGFKATYATLKRTNQIDKQVIVQISANKVDQLILPTEVLFEKGASEKIFNIGTVNNSQVEGERVVTVSSKIKFDSCNCVDDRDLASITKQDVTILDNDGLALSIILSPSTVKAGATGTKLTVSRNTESPEILQNPVTVNLSSTLPTVVELPSTATIPAGSKEVQITFNTKIDSNLTSDQSIRIQGEALGYTPGFGWLLVSDQNKSDAVITKVIASTGLEAGKKATVKTTIQNQGNVVFPTGYKLEYYISKNNNITGLTPVTSSVINKSINIGESYEHQEEIQLPNLSGDVYVVAVVNSDKSINELTYDNNQNQILIKVLPAYNVSVSVPKPIYKTGETVLISGTAKTAAGAVVQNTEVTLRVKNQEFSRDFDLKTNANGAFTYEYKPLGNESGSYNLGAAFPGEEILSQATFELLGLEIVNKPQYVKWETLAGVSLGKEFILKNKTKTALTGVKIKLPADADFTIDQTPIDIEAGATVTFPYKIVSTVASKEVKYYEIKIALTSNEGAEYSEIIYYNCKNQEAVLEVNPISINTTMIKDKTRLYEFSLKNIGAVDAEKVEVLLPELGWMRLSSQTVIERIKAGEEVKVVLELQPTVKEQVNVPISGSLVAKQKTGASVAIPFRITTVSESTGKLIVDATDEYTYNTPAAPHLRGAKVTVKQPYTGVIVAEGLTNDAGLFEVPNIPEGWYTIDISAEKHNPYQNNILVDPGRETKITAFMSYQAISYSWDVKPTEIKDEYDIKLQVQFETNVPKPVIVMEVDDPKLNLKIGESRMSYITVTNHGLIAAQKIKITAGELEGYTATPLITSLDVLNAKTSIVIPVLLKNESSLRRMSKASSGGGCGSIPIDLTAIFVCAGEKTTDAHIVYISGICTDDPPRIQPGPSTPSYGTPCTLGGCSWASVYSDAASALTGIDMCDKCTKKAVGTVYKCGKIVVHELTFYSCAYGLLTASSLFDVGVGLASCFIKKLKVLVCAYYVAETIYQCLLGGGSKRLSSQSSAPKGNFDFIYEDFQKINNAQDATAGMVSEYLKNSQLEEDNPDLEVFLQQVYNQVDNEKLFTPEDILRIKNNLKNTSITPSYVDEFTTRWNTTISAWSQNILSPNSTYPNIVDKVKINQYKNAKTELASHTFKRGFVSAKEMYDSGMSALEEYAEEKSKDQASVCATVSLEFPQKLTMTRQAFEGKLKINNSSDLTVKDVNLDLIVRDENGENKTYLFQVNKEAFLNGTGVVNPNAEGMGLVTFIPTKEAAPTVKQSYSFGGTLSYFDPQVNERVTIQLNPVTLEVNPSPDLVLHYFMQRDILGDDSLTPDVVEPTIPAELSLMINNEGYGVAKNVNVESAQPRIIDNDKGLLVDFKMIASNFNNEPRQLGLLNVNFGDIEAKQSAIGQWYFTSSLIGHFVKYDVKVVHKSSFGNANLSLIKASYIHELIKSVRSFEATSDKIDDFLVNDLADAYDTPDRIYLSNGTSEEVKKSDAIQIVDKVTPSTLTSKVKINPSTTGWNYNAIVYPEAANYELIKVVRDNDNVEIPLKNVWQTSVTLKDGLNPKYETKLHLLDKIADVSTYTLYYKPTDGNIPEVETFVDAPEKNNSKSVEIVKVKFNKEIDVNTFLNSNVQIISQGAVLPSDAILIGKIDAKTYSINIKELTKTSGYYELLVKTLGIKDLLGNEGKNGKKIEWLQFINELGILKFETDQIKKQPINTVKVIFNKPIRTEEFTADKITVNNLPVTNVTIKKADDYNYSISGFSALNQDDRDYKIAVDVTKITAVDGSKGLALQTYDWKVDNNLPKVVKLQTVSQGVTNSQNITQIEVELNRKLTSNFESSAIILTKNGQKVTVPFIIDKIDDLHYTIFGIGSYTSENATYVLTIDQSTFKDENENFGVGLAETSWTVRLAAVEAIADLKIAPDRGVSSTDNITSGSDTKLVYSTLSDNLNVEIYELLATSEILIDKQFRDKKGTYEFLLKDKVGAKRFKVVAIDANGNRSTASILSAYIDFVDFVTEIKPVNQNSNDCTDFDYVNVKFSEDVADNSFTKEAITLKSLGFEVPKTNMIVRKVTNKTYVLENIENQNDGSITLEIDKSQIVKRLTGLNGVSTETIELGNATAYPVSISGEENPKINELYTYTASENMNKYDWFIINGEIVSAVDNKVTVKWSKTNGQSLFLKYQTPLSCTSTLVKSIVVVDNTLGIDNPTESKKINLYPVPNDGQFTIQTNTSLFNCTIFVYNMSGQLVYQENNVNIDKNIKNINLSKIASGNYVLIIHNNQEKLNFKFIIN